MLASHSRGWEGGGTPRLILIMVDAPTTKSRKPSHLAVIVTRPLMLWRSARRSGKPKWAQYMLSSTTPSVTSHSVAAPLTRLTIQMTFTLGEYEAWKQCHAFTSTANLASTSGTHAFLASRSLWVIDSGASAHMNETPFILSSLTPTTTYPLLSIEDGRTCSVKGCGSTKPTPSLTLRNVLYVSSFPTNLLSISTITHTLNCVVIFYPFYCVF